ncbi:MAG TPA: terminase family protein [Terriglobales bacterium]|nr:terminase family protein [Terriglobales bacterium]
MPHKTEGTQPGAAALQASSALVKLYAYQKRWITDDSRFKLMIKGRQTGLTFATTLRHVRRRLARKGTTLWISASERQSKEACEYSKLHLSALREVFTEEEIKFPPTTEKAIQITFQHNGARMIFMPANPDTVRGFSGDVVLDEFAFHRDAVKIWRGAMAIISRGHSLEVISTPNGQAGKYWELCRAAGVDPLGGAPLGSMKAKQWVKGIWSVHWLDIHHAVAEGCPVNVVALREAAGDEDTWLQEYCCVFLADAQNYIPMELVIACESSEAQMDCAVEDLIAPIYSGTDIGRRKDRTVSVALHKLGDTFWMRRMDVMERTPFAAQFSAIDPIVGRAQRACVDATGIGAQIAEDLRTKHGGKVEEVMFNLENKEKMATLTKTMFEERRVRIPASPVLRRSINAVKRYTSPTGHFRFDAASTEAGHADEFWALALALAAGASAKPAVMGSVDVTEAYHARMEDRGVIARTMHESDVGARQPEAQPVMVRAERRTRWIG